MEYFILFILSLIALYIYCIFPRFSKRKALEPYKKYDYAHRGYHNDVFPENTLAAFENAKNHGYGIELDVQLTKDNICVIAHDFHLLRACGIDKQIDALQEANDALEEQIEYEQKLDAVAQARQKKAMVYKDGRWQYVEDVDAVSTAVKALEDYQRQRRLDEQIDGLEKEKDAINAIKDAWNNMTKEFEDAKDRWLISQKLMIDTTLNEWQRLVSGVENYSAQYSSIMTADNPYKTTKTSTGGYSTVTSKGGSVTYSSPLAIDFIENQPAGSVMTGGDGSTWYKRGDGSTVVTATDGAIAVINAQYANGTLGATGGLALVGEHGAELRVMNQGDGIIPAELTKNLMSWGRFTPNEYKTQSFGEGLKNAMNVTIQALNLPNVVDGQGFVDYIRNNMFGQVLSFVH